MNKMFLLALAMTSCCSRVTVPPPADDAAPEGAPPSQLLGDDCARACATLAWLGCVEGGARCAALCRVVPDGLGLDVHPKCLAAARTRAEARLCGSVACP